jgi:HSP20 family protein
MIKLGKGLFDRVEDSIKELSIPTAFFSGIRTKESETEYIVSVDIPGYKKDEVKVTLDDNTLRITAEMKLESTNDEQSKEVCGRKFKTSIGLGEDVNLDKISATLSDGVLTITIGKKEVEPKEFKHIEIK